MSKIDYIQHEILLREVAKITSPSANKSIKLFPDHTPNNMMLTDLEDEDWLQVFREDAIILGRCHPTAMR